METYRWALSQLVRGHHLDVEVFGLRLASGLDEPLQHLKAKRTDGKKVIFMPVLWRPWKAKNTAVLSPVSE